METKELLKKVRKIEIKTRRLSNHIFSGEYHSHFKGRGMTFSEVRKYHQGDDIRDIDWNVTAKLNEPHIKIFEEERELTMMLMVDVSKSESFGTRVQQKRDLITELCAVLSFSAIQNNDKVGVIFFTDQIELYIPPKKGKSHILRIIRELIEFKPMYNLSDYVSLEELKEVKFATLKNKIRIENEKIIIPEMDIHSTALSVHVSGEHSFANIMDYKVSLLLSDVLGNKVKESMSLEEIEHNQDGKTTIQLKMSGHVDDPKISLDKVQLKEDIVNEIVEEGEEVIKIIENKILNKGDPDTKEEKEKEEELDIEIEWDDKNPKK